MDVLGRPHLGTWGVGLGGGIDCPDKIKHRDRFRGCMMDFVGITRAKTDDFGRQNWLRRKNTKSNLLQWGETISDLCKLCIDANQNLQGRRKETTTHHILNGCSFT